ncbi:MAG: beta-ketoacyl-ACP synthase III [Gemmatimonas sp.]
MRRAIVAGSGAYLPDRILTNDEIARTLETSDEWIRERTGIRERRIAAPGQATSDLATRAADRALSSAGMKGEDIDLIVLATSTPDDTFPASAVKVQAALGANRAAAFDVQAVCSGFVYALSVANNFIRVGEANNVLVIGAETFSRIVDWSDRATCVLFGDGAGAIVLRAGEGKGTSADRGVLSTHLHSDGRKHQLLYANGGPSTTGTVGMVKMHGREVFKHAVINLASVLDEALTANGLSSADIDWLVPHQANKRILDSTAAKLHLPPEKMVVTVDRHANTSAASIPLAVAEAHGDGRIKPGQLVVMEAMGGGFTWAAAVVRW